MAGERWLALDGLRGVAILLVVAAHGHVLSADVGGMVGVTLFFVLSGFLITNLLIQELDNTGRIDLKGFYGRRALRLLPALVVYLGGISIVMTLLRLDVPVLETVWPPLLYVANYVQILGTDLVAHRHTWSLAVEEHFYLLWPILVGLGATKKLRLLGFVVVMLIGWRFAVYSFSENVLWGYNGTDTNAYALGMGAMLAAVRSRSGLPQPHRAVTSISVAGLVLLSLVQVNSAADLYRVSVWVPVLTAAVAVVAVWASVASREPGFLTARTLRWFGLISYSLYLWHAPILRFPALAETRLTRLAGVFLGVVVAWLSWKVVEGPIARSRFRQRLSLPRGALVSTAAFDVLD